MKYEINGKTVEVERELNEQEIDDIAAQLGGDSTSAAQSVASPPKSSFPQIPTGVLNAAKTALPVLASQAPVIGPMVTGLQLSSDMGRLEDAGGQAAEKLGQMGLPTPISATAGFAIANLPAFLGAGPAKMGPIAERTFAKAVPNKLTQFGVDAAKEAGIPLTRAEITGGRTAAGVESALEKTLTGSQPILELRAQQAEKYAGLTNTLSGLFGSPRLKSDVGTVAKTVVDANVNSFKQRAQAIYEQLPVEKIRPAELRLAAENRLKEELLLPRVDRDKGLMRKLNEYRKLGTKVQKVVDDNLQKVVYQRVDNPKAFPTTKAVQAMESHLNEAIKGAFKAGETMGNVSGRDAAILKRSLQRDLEQVEALKTQLTEANKLWRQAKNLDSNSFVKQLRAAKPEDVVGKVFDGGKVTNVKLAKMVMGEGGFKTVKRSFYSDLINSTDLPKRLSKYSQEFLNNTFSKEELTSLRKTAAIKTLLGAAEKIGGNVGSSRTNAAIAQGSVIATGLTTAGYSALTGNIPGALAGLGTAAGGYALPKLAAKAYLGTTNGLTIGGARQGFVRSATGAAIPAQSQMLNRIRESISKL